MPEFRFEQGRNCWRIEDTICGAVIIDAENYFRHVRRSMLKAQKHIILVGWDFDARVKMYDTEQEVEGPLAIGDYISWLVKRNSALHIYLLRWDTGAYKSLFRGKTILTLIKWLFHPRIHLRLDDKHPLGASQHQKIIVLDDDVAYCGGIDIIGNRWDTRAHQETELRRKQPDHHDRGPWHDAAIALQGPVAKSLADFARMRWQRAGGKPIPPASIANDCWSPCLEVMFSNVQTAIARSQPEMPDQQEIIEIENLYLDLIASAEKYIYAESQYFASRKIAEAIARRLDEPNGPEIVVINPKTADGWLEPLAMDTARKRLIEALRQRDKYDHFRLYHALNEAGDEIYVHAKITIVDDRILRIGSSNFNNRSLRMDTECDVVIEAASSDGRHVSQAIADVRNDLLAEHLGATSKNVAETLQKTSSLIKTIETLQKSGRTLQGYQNPDLSEVQEWLADNEILDPEGPDEIFASLNKRGLFRTLQS